MTDETIFGTDDQSGQNTPAPVLPDPLKDLVGPDKKYATVEDALKSVPHAQAHIAQLEAELKELRGKAEKAVSSEEVYATVQELLAAERKTNGTASLDVNALDGLLDRKLAERRAREQAAANVAVVKEALVSKFGDKAEEVYRTKAKEAGVGVDFLNSAAAHSPQAALKLLGLDPAATTGGGISSSSGSVNTAALPNQERKEPPKVSVMGGASMADIITEMKRHRPKE